VACRLASIVKKFALFKGVNEAAYAALDALLSARRSVLMLGELICLGFSENSLEFSPLSLQK
jgi:hypothetical protein